VSIPAYVLGKRFGPFMLERVLGRGRMGVVYLARDEALLRPTALKVLSWMMPKREGINPEAWFLSEARSMARINHPNVVQIYGVGKHEAYRYIAMEYVAGDPAEMLVARHGPMSPERATETLAQAAAALSATHEAGVFHCDVKPENLLVTSSGATKLGDFGMARPVPAGKGTERSERDGVRAGTPFYTAPELWRGEPASHATDVYALGATYFYLLTGRRPFEGADLDTVREAHLHFAIPDVASFVPNAPPGCGHIVRRCLAKSARDRFASAQALVWEAVSLLRK